jgi:hypothetical protein
MVADSERGSRNDPVKAISEVSSELSAVLDRVVPFPLFAALPRRGRDSVRRTSEHGTFLAIVGCSCPRGACPVILVWPAVVAAGFLVLTVFVVALASSSTARYELERNGPTQPERPRPAPPVAPTPPAAGNGTAPGAGERYRSRLRGAPGSARTAATRATGGRTLLRARPRKAASGAVGSGVAPHASVGRSAAVGWWLVADVDDEAGDATGMRVVGGPFADELEATWAALAGGIPESAHPRVVHACRREDGALVRREAPEERTWLAELSSHLDHLSDDWDDLVSDGDELTSLVVEVTAALVEAGLPLYGAGSPAGGVCLTPDPWGEGVLVTWRQHDRVSLHQVRGAAADAAVQERMSRAVADVLAELGFVVAQFGGPGCHLVTGIA